MKNLKCWRNAKLEQKNRRIQEGILFFLNAAQRVCLPPGFKANKAMRMCWCPVVTTVWGGKLWMLFFVYVLFSRYFSSPLPVPLEKHDPLGSRSIWWAPSVSSQPFTKGHHHQKPQTTAGEIWGLLSLDKWNTDGVRCKGLRAIRGRRGGWAVGGGEAGLLWSGVRDQ